MAYYGKNWIIGVKGDEAKSISVVISVFCLRGGQVTELLHPSEFKSIGIYLNVISLVFAFTIKIVVATSGSDLTKEAENTSVIISKIMNELDYSEVHKAEFIFLITLTKSRNINVQNILFVINWNMLLAVSCQFTYHFIYVLFS